MADSGNVEQQVEAAYMAAVANGVQLMQLALTSTSDEQFLAAVMELLGTTVIGATAVCALQLRRFTPYASMLPRVQAG